MRAFLALVCTALLAACTPMPGWHISHAVGRRNGKEYHSCYDGSSCEEGYACTRFGCEWCGDDGVPNRCTEGNDGDQPGIDRGTR